MGAIIYKKDGDGAYRGWHPRSFVTFLERDSEEAVRQWIDSTAGGSARFGYVWRPDIPDRAAYIAMGYHNPDYERTKESGYGTLMYRSSNPHFAMKRLVKLNRDPFRMRALYVGEDGVTIKHRRDLYA